MNALKLKYLVDSNRGLVWCKVGDKDWYLSDNVKENPKRYFSTLKGIFYIREYPESAVKLLDSYTEHELSKKLNSEEEDLGEDFSRN